MADVRSRCKKTAGMPGTGEERRKRAMAVQALLLGGLLLARGMRDSGVSEELLEACREAVPAISG